MGFFKSALAALAVAATTFALASNAKAEETLRIGTEGAYPPFNMVDKDGHVQGFDVDIAKALCAEMQVKCEFVLQDWNGIIPALNNRKYDAIIASMSVTEKRQRAVLFTNHYYTNKLRFIAPKSATFDIEPSKLAGKIIGAQRATIAATWFKENYKNNEVKLYDTQENAFLDLKSGRLDGIIADMMVNYEWLQKPDGADFEFKGPAVYENDKIAIAVRKADKKLAERFNKAIDAIVANGTYQKINAKYFPFDIY
jgi:polar amino acid transport system substrate-binding protein